MKNKNYRNFCEKSILWVLDFRQSPRNKMLEMFKNGFVDGHTEETWNWTLKEAANVQKRGFKHWVTKTDGPYGYRYWKDKHSSY